VSVMKIRWMRCWMSLATTSLRVSSIVHVTGLLLGS
jgi:hypothetical protein